MTEKLVLEAQISTSANDPCAICERWKERRIGMTEIYTPDTGDWVCYDCAFALDRGLALFTYAPEESRKTNRRGFQSGHLGVCPECGRLGEFFNVGPVHWCVCRRHGLTWRIGENLFSGWRNESREQWLMNADFLCRCREVESYRRSIRTHGIPTIVHGLKRVMSWCHRTMNGLGEEDPPF
jgi:hypothetical protein